MPCMFCDYLAAQDYLAANDLAFAIYDQYPVNQGHVLIIPKRHFASYFDATPKEVVAFHLLIKEVKAVLDEKLKPAGFNVGINCGEAAGQTIFHLHIHLIPRYWGDVSNPRGGIRRLKKALVEYEG